MHRLLAAILGVMAVHAYAGDAAALTAKQLTELPVNGWITNGGNVFNQRYSPLAEINSTNVGSVKAEWQAHEPTRSSGANAGRTAVTAVQPPPRAIWCSPAVMMVVSSRSIRATAMSCGSFRPAPA